MYIQKQLILYLLLLVPLILPYRTNIYRTTSSIGRVDYIQPYVVNSNLNYSFNYNLYGLNYSTDLSLISYTRKNNFLNIYIVWLKPGVSGYVTFIFRVAT